MGLIWDGATLFFACEAHHEIMSPTIPNTLYVQRDPTPYGSLFTLTQAVSTPGLNDSYGYAIATEGSSGSHLFVSAKRDGDVGAGCATTDFDLEEWTVTKTGPSASAARIDNQHVTNTGSLCFKESRSSLALDETHGWMHATWTSKNVAGPDDDLFSAVRATSSSSWPATPVQITGSGSGDQDHSIVTVRSYGGGERAIVFHDQGQATYTIQLRLENASQATIATIPIGTGNFPYLVDRGNTLFAAWEHNYHVYGRYCTATSADYAQCDTAAEWNNVMSPQQIDPGTASHTYGSVEIAVDSSGDLFAVYEDEFSNDTRVRLSRVCGPSRSSVGSSTMLIDNSQSTEWLGEGPVMGLPAIVVDDANARVEISYVRTDAGASNRKGMRINRPISDFCN